MSANGTEAAGAPRIAIHIGLKKSGSATLQTFFSEHADALHALDIDYPVVSRQGSKAHHNLPRELRGRKNFSRGLGGVSDMVEYLNKSPARLTVMSSEMFESLTDDQVYRFRQMVGEVTQPITIVIVIRNLIDLIASSYAQKVRYGLKNHDFDSFFTRRMAESRVSYFTTTEKWAIAFGWENIRVRVLDTRFLRNGDLIDDFLETVGVDPDDPAFQALAKPGIVNSASGWRVLEAVRALYCRKNPLPPAHRLIKILQHATTLDRRKKIEQAAIEAGRERGWQEDRGAYLTARQAQIILDLYSESVSALNERLPTPLPMPDGLEARGFVEREFLPHVNRIPRRELMAFYQDVTDRLDANPRLFEAPRSEQEARRDIRAPIGVGVEDSRPFRKREVEKRDLAPGEMIALAKARGGEEATMDGADAMPGPAPRALTFSGSPVVRRLSRDVEAVFRRDGRLAGLRHAMSAIEPLLEKADETLRIDLRQKVFKPFASRGVSYQYNDFECVDYDLYELAADIPLLRGPAVSPEALDRGDYFCVVGGAQTFGRLVTKPWTALLSEAVGLPALNLSRSGAGPDVFRTARILRLIQNARFVVLQVMSGRNVSDGETFGGNRGDGHTELEGVNRWEALERLWRRDPAEAFAAVRRWNDTYVAAYRQLRELIARPTLSLWFASRRPEDWKPRDLLTKLDWGDFPQLIGDDTYERVAALADERVEFVTGISNVQTISRVTGLPCPYFGLGKSLHTEMIDNPSSDDHADLAEELTPWARGLAS